jgi:predicted ATP-grasp superfamily ATP-dependent carboligase
MTRVLVFPCGSEIALEIERSLRYAKEVELWGASSTSDHGQYAFANYVDGVPFVDDDGFVEAINRIVEEHEIDFIFPAHDSVVLALAQRRADLRAVLLTSDVETCEITRSKAATYRALSGAVRVPATYSPGSEMVFPVFLKPDVGQGSKGVLKAFSLAEVEVALGKDPSLLVLEYLPGDEFTVDCFTNAGGELLFAQPRTRSRVSNGISVRSSTVELPEAVAMARRINESLSLRGAWFFQVKRDEAGELALLEVAPRIAGTMGVSRLLGANLPLLTLLDAQGNPVTVLPGAYRVEVDRALTSRFHLDISFDTAFVDFDDTIALQRGVNAALMAVLYDFVSRGVRLVLVTRHAADLSESLRRHRIDPGLFDDVIHLVAGEPKSSSITAGSIFIDDSFNERQGVARSVGIPVFDVGEALELFG